MTDPIARMAQFLAGHVGWENETRPLCATNAQRPLTRSLDLPEEGLAMQATRTCSITGCDRPHRARGWCTRHYQRWASHGDPLAVAPNPAMLRGAQNCKWQGDDIGYTAAHDRVRAALGPATLQACIDCSSPAEEWSYDHNDPDERVEPDDPKRKPYSVKPAHYQPRCASCHWRIDHPTGKRTRV